MEAATHHRFLRATDPHPVEVVNGEAPSDLLLLCEHAGKAVPAALGDLGVSQAVLDSHRGWDIGAAAVARRLADRLSAPLILQRYSRLVIDCNRAPSSPGSILAVSDGAAIPRNRDLDEPARAGRVAEIFEPLDRAISDHLSKSPRRAVFSIHSFTPEMEGRRRPWDAGFLTRADLPTARRLMARIAAADPALSLALNEPYRIEDDADWFIPRHAETRGLRHCLIEIRNDRIRDDDGAERWAERLAVAIADFMETLT